MCRSIKVLRTGEVAATPEEIRAAALQFVRKISGFQKPSKANEAAWAGAIDEISASAERLLGAVTTNRARRPPVEAPECTTADAAQ